MSTIDTSPSNNGRGWVVTREPIRDDERIPHTPSGRLPDFGGGTL